MSALKEVYFDIMIELDDGLLTNHDIAEVFGVEITDVLTVANDMQALIDDVSGLHAAYLA